MNVSHLGRSAVVVCASLALFGCRADTAARMLTLRTALLPSSQCGFLIDNDAVSDGYYDPWLNAGEGAVFGLLVENFTGATGDELVGQSPQGFVDNVETVRHNAQIEAVEGCFFATNTLNAPPHQLRGDGSVIDCATLPEAQRRVDFVSNTVDEGSGKTAITVRALEMRSLRALFGDTFDPLAIPVIGASVSTDPWVNPSAAGLTQLLPVSQAYSLAPAQPGNPATRSAAWGQFYPTQSTATVLLQVRVRAKMQSGSTVHSNWYILPVTVCPGCLRDYCGPLVQKVCGRGVCTDGTPCMSDGTCAAGSPAYCTPIQLMSGTIANWHVEGACLPAQNYPGAKGPTCEEVGCGVQ